MALIRMDGFDHHRIGSAHADDTDRYKFDTSSGYWVQGLQDDTLRTGARVLNLLAADRLVHWYWLSLSEIYMGLAIRSDHESQQPDISISNSTAVQVHFDIQADGSLIIYRGTGGTQLWDSVDTIFPQADWNYWEFNVVLSDTVGVVHVKKNGVTVINLTSQDTLLSGNETITAVHMRGAMYIDDFWIDDAQFHGPCRIETLWPDGDGNYSQMAPSAGDNYECVDDSLMWNTSDYVTGDAADERDTFTFESIPALSGSAIKGIAVNNIAQKTDVNTVKIKNTVRVNGSDYDDSVEKELETTYRIFQTIWDDNPDDAAAWEEADINAMEAGAFISTI